MESYKNFWSLNVDEAIVAGKLQDYFKKSAQVCIPLNAQLKDVDLLVFVHKKRKGISIQVKGSKAYEPNKAQRQKYGDSVGWFFIEGRKIKQSMADFFVFLVHVISDSLKGANKKVITTHLITLTPDDLYKICRKKKVLHKRYSFYFSIDPINKTAIEHRDAGGKGIIYFTKYLDEKGLKQLEGRLKLI